MKCGLCKTNNVTSGMAISLKDVNGTIRTDVCQPCLKKLKNAVRGSTPMRIDVYPVTKEEKNG